jgi:SH3-like domain-containing protein
MLEPVETRMEWVPAFRRDSEGWAKGGNLALRKLKMIAGMASMLLMAMATSAGAGDPGAELKVPRFVSLHSDRVNLRTGPGRQYPIEWVLVKRDMPVEVIQQFEHWRRVREWDGTVGWVQEHMVDGRRYVIVAKGGVRPMYQGPDANSPEVARAEPGVLGRLLECSGAMCRIEANDVSGWMRRTDLWGVYPDEKVP